VTLPSASSDVIPPARVGRLMRRADELLDAGREQAALALLIEAAADDPTPAARIALAVVLAPSRPQQAVEELERALELARQLQCPRFRALCCANLSVLHRRLKNTHLALRYRQSALAAHMELAGEDPEAALPAEVLIELAGLWLSTPDAVWAECLLKAAAAGRPGIPQQAQIASHRGAIAARAGHCDDAILHWAQAQRQFREVGEADGAAHTLVNLGHLLQGLQRFSMARRAFLIARDLFLEVRLERAAAAADRFAREAAARARLRATDPASN
jgi:tetratricopeptide (TPR) repeat protein